MNKHVLNVDYSNLNNFFYLTQKLPMLHLCNRSEAFLLYEIIKFSPMIVCYTEKKH